MREFSLLPTHFDRLLDEVLNAPTWKQSHRFSPAVDIQETETHFLIAVDVPGVKKEDIKIEFLDGKLNVSGHRRLEKLGEKSTWTFNERVQGDFERSFQLGRELDTEHIEANHKDGVLYISIPKAEKAKPRLIKIES